LFGIFVRNLVRTRSLGKRTVAKRRNSKENGRVWTRSLGNERVWTRSLGNGRVWTRFTRVAIGTN
jgi:hypothetical protein